MGADVAINSGVDDAPTLRVAVDASPLHGQRTGIGLAVAQMCAELSARSDVETVPYLLSARARRSPGEIRLPVPGIVASHLWSRTSRWSADRWLGDIDVIHGTNYVVPPTRHGAVVSVYDCWFLAHQHLAHPNVARAGRWLGRAVADGAWVHASSHATAKALREFFVSDRVRVVELGPPPPIDTATRQPSGVDRVDIVAIGTEEVRKGYPDLVAAFDVLARDHADATLVIAGAQGDDSPRLSAAIADARAAPRIVRLGRVSTAEKAWLLRHARVLAYPSLDEGFGFPILEANQAGIPIAARAVGSIPEVAGASALLVADDDRFIESYAEVLHRLVVSADTAADLARAGTANLERFSWHRCASGLVDLYRSASSAAR